MASNLPAHHLDVPEDVGLAVRSASSGDGRRRYVRLVPDRAAVAPRPSGPRGEMLFPVYPAQVVTVCDRVHEELTSTSAWWDWSIPDPVEDGSDRAFDAVADQLEARIRSILRGHGERQVRV